MNKILLIITSLIVFLPALSFANPSNTIAKSLYKELSGNNEGNLFFSPYSISEAMAMGGVGAAGNTKYEISKALGFRDTQINFEQIANERISMLGVLDTHVNITIANSIWPERTFSLRQDFKEQLKRYFGVSVNAQDFLASSEKARVNINNWVANKTNKKIKDLIPPETFSPETRLVLVNAIYVHAKWLIPFKKEATHQAEFYISPNESLDTSMMVNTEMRRYLESDLYQGVLLPYRDQNFAMVVIVPKEDVSLSEVEHEFTSGKILASLSQYTDTKVTLYLPKIKIDSSVYKLAKPLANIGIKDAFDRDKADFSLISDAWKSNLDDRLFISDVLHKAYVSIDEEGTEAAAATAVIMEMMGSASYAQEQLKIVRVNRPFLFFILAKSPRKSENQKVSYDIAETVLLLGRIVYPKNEEF
jgi:serpin B